MRSLTSLIPALAPIFGLTEKMLYERQKSLVRMKMLPTPQGRGRGSGATATPENVAWLIIAVMATDKQADEERVLKLAFAPFVDGKKERCPLSGAATFKDAMAFVLSPGAAVSKPGRVIHTSVNVSRTEPAAQIWFGSMKPKFSQFGKPDRGQRDHLLLKAELPNDALRQIRLLLSDGGSS